MGLWDKECRIFTDNFPIESVEKAILCRVDAEKRCETDLKNVIIFAMVFLLWLQVGTLGTEGFKGTVP